MSSPIRKLQKIQKVKKVKVRQYNSTYLKFSFTTAPHDVTRPMDLVCGFIFSNEAMKPSRLQDPSTELAMTSRSIETKKQNKLQFNLFLNRLTSDRNMA